MGEFTIRFSKKKRELSYEEEIAGIMWLYEVSREEAKAIRIALKSNEPIGDCVDENYKPHPLGLIAGFELPDTAGPKPKRKSRPHPTKRRKLHY
jgi:hypothetical protein